MLERKMTIEQTTDSGGLSAIRVRLSFAFAFQNQGVEGSHQLIRAQHSIG